MLRIIRILVFLLSVFGTQQWDETSLETLIKTWDVETSEGYPNQQRWIREDRSGRLPNTTFPLRYHLHLTQLHSSDKNYENYRSNCTIEIGVRQNTDEIVLHARSLKILSVALEDLTTQTPIKNVVYILDEKNQQLIVKTEGSRNSCPKTFDRDHRLRLTIFYKRLYFHGFGMLHHPNQTHYGFVGRLGVVGARSDMPCYDEPRFKSNFTLRLTHKNNWTAFSNMPPSTVHFDSVRNLTITTFMETPPISLNSIAFVVANSDSIIVESDDIVQRVRTPTPLRVEDPVKPYNMTLALRLFGDYMEIPYMLPQMVQFNMSDIYVREQSWGIISGSFHTYDEYEISRRIANQWFGNLVSPALWDSVWLSKSLAQYYSYTISDLTSEGKEYTAMERFDLEICFRNFQFMDGYAIASTHEMTPTEIRDLYYDGRSDNIEKASCIFQMFDHAFGKEVFHKGVSNYLKENAYSVADENDLYDALQSAAVLYNSNLNKSWEYRVHDIMKSWTNNRGLPTVIITRNYDDNSVNIRQKSAISNSTELWWIPLNFVTASQPNFESTKADFFMPPIAELTIDLSVLNITLRNDDWLIVNKQGKGLYSVNYDPENLRRIANVIKQDHTVIHRSNRGILFVDILKSLVYLEAKIDITLLELIKYLSNEEDDFAKLLASGVLHTITRYLKDTGIYEMWKSYLYHIVEAMYDKSFSYPDKLKILDGLACQVELPKCLLEQKNILLNRISRNEIIPRHKDNASVCHAVKLCDNEEFERIVEFHANRSEWRDLACTRNEKQYEKLLQKVFDFSTDASAKMYFVAKLPFSKELSARNSTWIMWDQYITHIFNASPHYSKEFCDNLENNLNYKTVRRNDKVQEAVEMCEKKIQFSFDLNKPYKYSGLLARFLDNSINDDVVKWLKKENSNFLKILV